MYSIDKYDTVYVCSIYKCAYIYHVSKLSCCLENILHGSRGDSSIGRAYTYYVQGSDFDLQYHMAPEHCQIRSPL